MKLMDALEKSDCNAAQRPGLMGSRVTVLRFDGGRKIRVVHSLSHPSARRVVTAGDMARDDWQPVVKAIAKSPREGVKQPCPRT